VRVTDIADELHEEQPPRGEVRIVYLGPVAPHWDIQAVSGDRTLIDEFRQRAEARLLLLPPHDPQFRRNRERVIKDAEREGLLLEWDLGVPEEEPPGTEPGTAAE
jgi:hypothetical protein